jgi:hypothetical protein
LFRYEDAGLLDRTHLRWFTRITIKELFESTGFAIVEGGARIFDQPSEVVLSAIRELAYASNADPELAAADALPLQWVVRAEPR